MPDTMPVLPVPIIFTRCAVCDKPFKTPRAAFFGDENDIIANESCEHCYQWFRLEEISLTILKSDAFDSKWAQPFDPEPDSFWEDMAQQFDEPESEYLSPWQKMIERCEANKRDDYIIFES